VRYYTILFYSLISNYIVEWGIMIDGEKLLARGVTMVRGKGTKKGKTKQLLGLLERGKDRKELYDTPGAARSMEDYGRKLHEEDAEYWRARVTNRPRFL
jgi:hypothetical protein